MAPRTLLTALVTLLVAVLALTAAPSPSVAGPQPLAGPPASQASADRPSASRDDGLPPQSRWEADVRAAMAGSIDYLQRRARRARANGVPVRRLAVNLDIDNTALASTYDHGQPVYPTRRFARAAHELGMRVFFNSARPTSAWRRSLRGLRGAGYHVDRLCLARRGERVRHSKQRCRRGFGAAGFRIVANVGNRSTDFVGSGYERAFKLPDYGGRLG